VPGCHSVGEILAHLQGHFVRDFSPVVEGDILPVRGILHLDIITGGFDVELEGKIAVVMQKVIPNVVIERPCIVCGDSKVCDIYMAPIGSINEAVIFAEANPVTMASERVNIEKFAWHRGSGVAADPGSWPSADGATGQNDQN
jgi:hypothetical protein